MAELIKPVDVTITDADGKEHHYIFSNFDAIAGREILMKYTIGVLPKIGEYPLTEDMMRKLMSHVAVKGQDGPIRLTTDALIKNHVPDAETLFEIERQMMAKNFSFFRDGRILGFFEGMTQTFLQKIIETLTHSSQSSSIVEKPRTEN